MHAVKPNQQIRILTIQIAVAADADPDSVADEMSELLTGNGICSDTSHILDWRYLTEYHSPRSQPVTTPRKGKSSGCWISISPLTHRSNHVCMD